MHDRKFEYQINIVGNEIAFAVPPISYGGIVHEACKAEAAGLHRELDHSVLCAQRPSSRVQTKAQQCPDPFSGAAWRKAWADRLCLF